MTSVFDFRDFEARFRSGLIFSIFEGLVQGGAFKIISQNPLEIESQFQLAKLPNLRWDKTEIESGIWQINIHKNSQKKEGCFRAPP